MVHIDKTTRRASSWAKGFLRAFLILFAVFGLAELGIRLTTMAESKDSAADEEFYRQRRALNRGIYMRSPGPDLVYEPRPGGFFQMPYGPAGFNLAGMRDVAPEVPEFSPEAMRIAVLGDSVVWSEDLALEEALPARLAQSLAPGPVAVFNFGVSGYDTRQELVWYSRAVRPQHPDLVVVVFCLNDFLIMSGPYGAWANEREARAKEEQDQLLFALAPLRAENIKDHCAKNEQEAHSKLWARIECLWWKHRLERDQNYRDEILLMFQREESKRRVAQALSLLGKEISQDGAVPILVISPILRSWDHYRWMAVHDWIKENAERAGFQVFDPLPSWLGSLDVEEMHLPGDALHYSFEGTKVFAQSVASFLRPWIGSRRKS